MLINSLNSFLDLKKQQGLYRCKQLCPENYINFSSNDYLSLSNEPIIKNAYVEGFKKYPVGSGGSMLLFGYHPIHKDLEGTFAKALNVDSCILFSSGYAANLSLMSLFSELDVTLLIDKSIHASIYDGLKLNKINFKRFLHNDLNDLQKKLTKVKNEKIILTESIFSMSGQYAPLLDIIELCSKSSAHLLVDEAHAFGILGKEGLGAIPHYNLDQNSIPLRVIPLGKAFGSSGAIIAGQNLWIEALLQKARSYIYSTGISPALTYGLLETLQYVRKAEDRREKLFQLVTYFRQKISQSSLKWCDSRSPIQQLQIGCPHKSLDLTKKLLEKNIICSAIRQPTVNHSETGLKIVLNYNHKVEDIDFLFGNINLCRLNT